jgi:FtsH-binding integral membrane protein
MNERVLYEHRQVGWLTIVFTFVMIAALSVAFGLSEKNADQRTAFNFVVIAVAVGAALFSSLTIRVTEQYVAWWFGIPLIGRRVALAEIASITQTRTNIWEGWGVHLTFWHGWVWNIAGFNAIEIVLRSGTRFAVGTPQPQAVIDAVQSAGGKQGS